MVDWEGLGVLPWPHRLWDPNPYTLLRSWLSMSQCSPRPHGLSYIPSFPTGIIRGPPARRHSLRPHGLEPTRLLCPWDFPGKNIGVGCHFLLQGGLPDPGIKLTFPALQADYWLLEPSGKSLLKAYWKLILQWKEKGKERGRSKKKGMDKKEGMKVMTDWVRKISLSSKKELNFSMRKEY